MKKKVGLAILLLISVGLFFGVVSKDVEASKDSEDKIKVMASIYPIEQFVKVIGGDKVYVRTMVPKGAEPHDFEPKAKDIVELNNSDIFIYNGLNMESWVPKILDTIENKSLIVLNSSENAEVIGREEEDNHEHEEDHIDEDYDHESHEEQHNHEGHEHNHDHEEHEEHSHGKEEYEHHGHSHGKEDPHIWLGLDEAKKQCELIKDNLIKIDPNNKEYYEENYLNFSKDLESLKKEYEAKFNSVKNKDFITGHEAFAYLCRDFGLEQKGLEGIFGEGEVTPRQLRNLVNYCKEKSIKTVFMPDTASEKLSQTLAKEVGAKVVKISSLETNSYDKGYIESMKINLELIYENIK